MKKKLHITKFRIQSLIWVIVFWAGTFNMVQAQFSGDGSSSDDPYLISTAADLTALANRVNNATALILPNTTPYNTAYYKLMDSINLSGTWTPIGNTTRPFRGTFDGNCHKIRNITITGNTTGYAGLFGYISDATIKNLGIVDCEISSTSFYIGGLVGGTVAPSSNISNCYVVSTKTITGRSNTGGLIGDATGTVISNSYASVNIIGSSNSIGGLAGSCTTAIVTNCYATGRVSSSSTTSTAGGLVGTNNGSTISYCYAKGSVIAASPNVGGLVGQQLGASANIQNCVAANDTVRTSQTNTAAINRIIGGATAGTYNYNYALNTMIVANGGGAPQPDLTSNMITTTRGYSISLDTLKSLEFYNTNTAYHAVAPAIRWSNTSPLTGVWNIGTPPTIATWEIDDGVSLPTLRDICKKITFTITASADNNGIITPSGDSTVNENDSVTYKFYPTNACYEIDTVMIKNHVNKNYTVVTGVTGIDTGYYTFKNIMANDTIHVTFKKKQFTITVSVGDNGSMNPPTTIQIDCGVDTVFRYTADDCYEVEQLKINGSPTTIPNIITGSYTFQNIMTNQTIEITFKKLSQYNCIRRR